MKFKVTKKEMKASFNYILISTGYSPLKSKNVKVKYADISEYNEIARKCNEEELKILLKEFIQKFEFEGDVENV
jgi:hypothetical protein